MYVCMNACMHVFIYVWYVFLIMHGCVCMYCMYLCIVCMFDNACMCMCMYVWYGCLIMHVYVSMYLCMV